MRITYENRNQIMEFKMSNDQLHEMRKSDSGDLVAAFLNTIHNQIRIDLEAHLESKQEKK